MIAAQDKLYHHCSSKKGKYEFPQLTTQKDDGKKAKIDFNKIKCSRP